MKIEDLFFSEYLIQEGSGLRLLYFRPSEKENPWEHDQTIPILTSHCWIEPGESIDEQFIFDISSHSDILASKVEVIIVSKKSMWESVNIIT